MGRAYSSNQTMGGERGGYLGHTSCSILLRTRLPSVTSAPVGALLHFSSWQQRLRPCVGLCPLHNVASAVPVPFLPALRYSLLGDPDPPSGCR